MTEKLEPSQQELVAKEQRKYFRGLGLGVGFGLAIVAIVFLLFSLPRSTATETIISYFQPGFIALLAAITVVSIYLRVRPKSKMQEESIHSKLIDERQRQYLWTNRIFLAVLVLIGLEIELIPAFRHDGKIAVSFALILVIASLSVSFGPVLAKLFSYGPMDDELTKALRARAARLGYVITMMALSIVSLLILFRPRLVARAMPIAMIVSVALPLIYLEVMEWRANRSV